MPLPNFDRSSNVDKILYALQTKWDLLQAHFAAKHFNTAKTICDQVFFSITLIFNISLDYCSRNAFL